MDPNVLLLSTRDIQGGAARAAYRLLEGLLGQDAKARMVVQFQDGDHPLVISPRGYLPQITAWTRSYLDVLPLKFYPDRTASSFSPEWVPDSYLRLIDILNPDIINLHWIGGGFLHLETLARFERPLVWTLHDMWAFTGGCHYNEGCEGYLDNCGCCPQLGSQRERDLSRRGWQRRDRLYPKLNLTAVTPSAWLAGEARRSPLLRDKQVEVIPNGIDLERFQPRDKAFARKVFGFPQDKRLILFGAQQATRGRKGGDLLQETITHLTELVGNQEYEIALFGKEISDLSYTLPTHKVGLLRDEPSLNLLYAAADVFVAPSRQDNLPNTILEALASGTPCAGFKIGGIPEMIDHQINGYTAQPFDTKELAIGLKWILEDGERWEELSKASREKAVRDYDQKVQTSKYRDLFRALLK